MNERVTLEIVDNIAVVTMNRPDKLNALDMPMFEGLAKTAKKLAKNRDIRAVILRGEGNAFCSGLDVKSIMKNPLAAAKLLIKPGRKISNLAQDVGYLWRQVPVPVIAVTQGKCWGGGFQIALGADFRYTMPDCEFSIMEMKWGLIPDMSGSITLRELIPIDLAKELTMTARIFDGNEAKEMGLVSHVSEKPFDDALAFAKEISKRSPDAIANAKKLFNETWTATEKVALWWETKLQKQLIGRWNQRASISQNNPKEKNPMAFKKRSK
ncbi:crotonase/enoyl-CoA hydratase family protein [Alkalimarinus coralli]|uniref:crotonase/enoyl-CoA hydratase family protein n=1 Tax=Alkalimarinus coralli TaxID=2935863 RepID=UPI00202AC2F0|nr:crotonase/enoyl-CoA hydratase family protein [Alkalimarinus coralli]